MNIVSDSKYSGIPQTIMPGMIAPGRETTNRGPGEWRPFVLAVMAVLLLTGCLLRLSGTGAKSMSHPEMWAPLIPLPVELADPPARNTLYEVLDYNLGKDVHPPGYYILMWFWMKCFGWSTWAIRIPSVIFGTGSIALVYALGALSNRRTAGLIGAALLAFNGYHIAWSGFGRMYAPATFLVLLSSVLLLRMYTQPATVRSWEGGLYFSAIVTGVSCHVLVWPVLVAQILWVLWNAWCQHRPIPEVWSLQVTSFLASAPLLTFAAYQSHHPVAELSQASWLYGRELVQFGFLLPLQRTLDLFPHAAVPLWNSTGAVSLSAVRIMFFCVSMALLVLGLRSAREQIQQIPAETSGPWVRVWLFTSLAALFVSAAFIWIVRNKSIPIAGTVLAGLLPIALTAGAALLSAFWKRLPKPQNDHSVTLTAMLAVMPFAILAALSLVKPVITQRGLVIILPLVLFVLALGLDAAFRRQRWTIPVLCLPLAYLHFVSIGSYRSMTIDPTDFHAWTDVMKPRIVKSDLIFVSRSWYGTPLLYYIHPPEYKIHASEFAAVTRQNPDACIWWLGLSEEQIPAGIQTALAGYHEQTRVMAGGGSAVLFTANGNPASKCASSGQTAR